MILPAKVTAAKSELQLVEILWKTIWKIMKEWDLCPVNSGCIGTPDDICYSRKLTPKKDCIHCPALLQDKIGPVCSQKFTGKFPACQGYWEIFPARPRAASRNGRAGISCTDSNSVRRTPGKQSRHVRPGFSPDMEFIHFDAL